MNHVAIETLHWIASGLLIPDILLLIGFAAFGLMQLGGLAGEARARWRAGTRWRKFLGELKADPARRLKLADIPGGFGLTRNAIALVGSGQGARERALDELQLQVETRLDRLLLGVRLGPILGLAGTLIPLGPTLLALTRWDLSTLSSQLVIAFNATVVGLFIGGACYTVQLVRRRWYRGDFADLEFVFARLEA